MDKKSLRKELINIRKSISNRKQKSTIIVNKIIKLKDYCNAKVIAIFKSLSDEVNTDYLINYSLKCGKIVLLPRVVGDNIVFIQVDQDTKYEKSKLGVMEPIFNQENVYADNIDLILVPGLGFDKDNNRIGYGKGYYDRFLKEKDICKIGICFKEQLLENIIVDKEDIPVDLVVTDVYEDDLYDFFTIREMHEAMEEVKYIKMHPDEYQHYNNIKDLMESLIN